MPNIRVELYCMDGSVININNITKITEQQHIFVERLKSYRDIITLTTNAESQKERYEKGVDVLSRIRNEICFKCIEKIKIYSSYKNLNTRELEEHKIQEYSDVNKNYNVCDIYRIIEPDNNLISDTICYIFASNQTQV